MNKPTNEAVQCEVCASTELSSVLNLGPHPMCDDLIRIGDSRVCREYPIEIVYCRNCCTAHQRFQIPKEDLFPSSYHYRSRFTADVLDGMKQLVSACVTRYGSMTGKKVLDIGCNDGSLLDFFHQAGATTFGIEPTGAAPEALAKGHTVVNDYLTPAVAAAYVRDHGQPDVITFTNVFAHIEDLRTLLTSVRHLMAPSTVLVIENHYLGAVIERLQFDTFYHEHPRTYSLTSFQFIARTLQSCLKAVEFPSRYGGNIRVFIEAGDAIPDEAAISVLRHEQTFDAELQKMSGQIQQWKSRKSEIIRQHVLRYGKLKAKAFPGRAAILVKLLGLTENEIEAVYEKPQSLKVGHYVPGTRIPIRSDDDLMPNLKEGDTILNLAWHISKEINQYLTSRVGGIKIIDILDQKDFEAVV